MKYLIILMLISGCAGASVNEPITPKADREYVPCTSWHLKDFVGKYCYKQCVKFKLWHKHDIPNKDKNCKKWFTDVIDMSNKDVHQEAVTSGKILIKESNR